MTIERCKYLRIIILNFRPISILIMADQQFYPIKKFVLNDELRLEITLSNRYKKTKLDVSFEYLLYNQFIKYVY